MAGERLLGLFGLEIRGADRGQADSRALDLSSVELDLHRNRDGGEVADLALELVIRAAGVPAGQRNPDRGRDLVGPQGRGERTLEEAVDRNRALAPGRAGHELGVEREHDRAPVAGGVRVADRADQGSAVPDQRVGDPADGFDHERDQLRELLAALDVDVAGAGADPDVAVVPPAVRGAWDLAPITDETPPPATVA